jgi:hypothetical protein
LITRTPRKWQLNYLLFQLKIAGVIQVKEGGDRRRNYHLEMTIEECDQKVGRMNTLKICLMGVEETDCLLVKKSTTNILIYTTPSEPNT